MLFLQKSGGKNRKILTGLLITFYCLLFTVHCSLFTVYCLLFTVHCSLFTISSFLTSFCFTAAYSLKPIVYLFPIFVSTIEVLVEKNGRKIIIAVDGYSSCGKSTVAKDVARRLNYLYLDSGAMYRAVTLYCLRNNMIRDGALDASALISHLDDIQITFRPGFNTFSNDTYLNGENVENEIRQLKVSQYVSPVAAVGEVRRYLVSQQREMGKSKGIVMDGRDIGTVVFPDAELKIFMTASPEIRAKRRYDELIAKGEKVDYEEIEANIIGRDHFDENREISPLRKANDAVVLDNSYLTREQQLQWVLDKVNERIKV